MHTTLFARGLATFAGLAVFGVAGYINVGHTTDPDMKIVVGTLAASAAVAAFILKCAIKQKSYGVALFALVGVIGGEAFGFVTTIERLMAARDERSATVATHNDKIADAKKRLADAVAAKASVDATAIETSAKKNCARNCKDLLLQSQAAAQVEVDAARAALANTEAPRTANHLAAATGIPPLVIDLVPSLAGTVALTLLGFVFLWYGHDTDKLAEVPDDAPKIFEPVPSVSDTREGKVVSWINEYQKKHGVPPSFTAVRREFQLPKATASRYRTRALG